MDKKVITLETTSEKKYKEMKDSLVNSNDSIFLEVDCKDILDKDYWNLLLKKTFGLPKYDAYCKIYNEYILEDLTWLDKKRIYIAIKNIKYILDEKHLLTSNLESNEPYVMHIISSFINQILPSWAEKNSEYHSRFIDAFKVFLIDDSSWTEETPPPSTKVIYLPTDEFDNIKKNTFTTREELVIKFAPPRDNETFVIPLKPFVRQEFVNDQKSFSLAMKELLLNPELPQKVVIFFDKFYLIDALYCRSNIKNPRLIENTLIYEILCYWFNRKTAISDSWKKDITFYVPANWENEYYNKVKNVAFETYSEKQYKNIEKRIKNGEDSILLEVDCKEILNEDMWINLLRKTFGNGSYLKDYYWMEEYIEDLSWLHIKKVYLVFRNVEYFMGLSYSIKSRILNKFFNIAPKNITLYKDYILSDLISFHLLNWGDGEQYYESRLINTFKVFFVENSEWTNRIEPPLTKAIYLPYYKYKKIKEHTHSNEEQLVLKFPKEGRQEFARVLEKYVRHRPLDNQIDFSIGLKELVENQNIPSKIIFFLEDLYDIDRILSNKNEEDSNIVINTLIHDILCYWFRLEEPVSNRSKKDIIFYLSKD